MNRGMRTAVLLLADLLVAAFSICAAIFLRMEFEFPAAFREHLPWIILLSAGVKLGTLLATRSYSIALAFISLRDVLRLCLAITASSILFGATFLGLRTLGVLFAGYPLSAIFIDWLMCLLLMSGWRFSRRAYAMLTRPKAGGKPTIIVGAGGAADQVLRSILSDTRARFDPVLLLDDNPSKVGSTLHGIPVAGSLDLLPEAIAQYHVNTVIIAMPTAPASAVRRAFELARTNGAKEVLILPDEKELFHSQISLRDLRTVELSDLLKRDEIKLDVSALAPSYENKVILVTGAAGSIGSEICRQLSRLNPQKLILLDREETGLFNIHLELHREFPNLRFVQSLTDIRDRQRLRKVLEEHRPGVVFHAAAYKHVPVLETNAEEALTNNVGGTITLARACIDSGVEKFVFISTDKAVEPVSIMGKSKRIGELLMKHYNEANGTRFVGVRFGNVLGSRGSVLEIFKNQIREGRPITITDVRMKRYFMLISEAVLLVLHAGVLGKGGEIFVLDMGEPVQITDLAQQMARLAGLDEVPMQVTGLRPGERLEEHLHSSNERLIPTAHPKLFLAQPVTPKATNGALSKIEFMATAPNDKPAAEVIDLILKDLET